MSVALFFVEGAGADIAVDASEIVRVDAASEAPVDVDLPALLGVRADGTGVVLATAAGKRVRVGARAARRVVDIGRLQTVPAILERLRVELGVVALYAEDGRVWLVVRP